MTVITLKRLLANSEKVKRDSTLVLLFLIFIGLVDPKGPKLRFPMNDLEIPFHQLPQITQLVLQKKKSVV